MIVKLLILFVLSIASGVLMRMGGSGNFSRMSRLVGDPICRISGLLLFWHPSTWIGWIMLALTFGAMIGTISSYHLFFPKPQDGNYGGFHFGLYGFLQGVACFPLIWAGLHWYFILGPAVLLAALLGVWFNNFNVKILCWESDVVQEFTRGLLICLTTPLICL